MPESSTRAPGTVSEVVATMRDVDRMLEVLDSGFPAVHTMSAAEARAAVAARAQPVVDDGLVSTSDVEVPGDPPVPVRTYRPVHAAGSDGPELPGIVFCHGGGFVFCDLDSHDGFCRELASSIGAVVVSVDYRRAPENRAPAAACDAYVALCWAAEHADELGVDPARLLVAGDSSGGNLAAVTALMARDRGDVAVAGQVLLYPVIEPDFDTESYRRYATGHFNTRAAMKWYWEQYVGDPNATLPEPQEYVVPTRAPSHADLPPAVVVVAGRDPLCSEGEKYADVLRAAGVPVRLRHYPELFHGFITIGPFPPARGARELLFHDVRTLLAKESV